MTDDTGVTPDPKEPAGENPAQPATTASGTDANPEPVEGLRSALKTERDARKAGDKRTRDLETRLREFEDRDKTEQEKVTARAAESERRAVEAEAKLLRVEVAAERSMAASAVHLLAGSTREEIEASADRLAAFVKDHEKSAPGFDGGARQTPAETKPPEQAHNDWLMRALGRVPQ